MKKNDLPMCPLTGEICHAHKAFHITEKGEKIQNFSLCQNCFKDFNQTNKNLTKLSGKEKLDTFFEETKNIISYIFKGIVFEPKTDDTKVNKEIEDLKNEIEQLIPKKEEEPKEEVKCPLCEYTVDDLTNKNRLGCGKCYETFEPFLNPLIKQYHKSNYHIGKYPANYEEKQMEEFFDEYDLTQYKIASLEDKLKDAIKQEKYEDAAVLRDTIATLKTKLSGLHPKTSEDQ